AALHVPEVDGGILRPAGEHLAVGRPRECENGTLPGELVDWSIGIGPEECHAAVAAGREFLAAWRPGDRGNRAERIRVGFRKRAVGVPQPELFAGAGGEIFAFRRPGQMLDPRGATVEARELLAHGHV